MINEDDLILDEGMPHQLKKNKAGIPNHIKLFIAAGAIIGILLIVFLSGGETPEPEPLDGTTTTTNFTIKNNLGEAPKIPVSPRTTMASPEIEEKIKQQQAEQSIDDVIKKKQDDAKRAYQLKMQASEKEVRSRKIKKGLIHFNGNSGTDLKKETLKDKLAQAANAKALSGLGDALQPTVHASTRAGMLPNRDMFITKGTFLDCALETAINSTLSGMISCRLTTNVYSTSGRVLLLERGSRITGEYQGGLKNGQSRIFAIWSRIETPHGVLIDINSPGTDPLGRTGHDGHIQNFFWKKFGAAILLSFIDDLSAAAGSQLGNTAYHASGGTMVLPTQLTDTKSYSDVPSKALEDSIDIPPVLSKNQGDHINIFVARDLDFRSVYELRTK
ncbi:MAG: type IV secretion system protein VirB10 [Cellvibrionales bacterium]|nr:type IV secretion system protein VirB10 [Cellvibrionales bacterium]